MFTAWGPALPTAGMAMLAEGQSGRRGTGTGRPGASRFSQLYSLHQHHTHPELGTALQALHHQLTLRLLFPLHRAPKIKSPCPRYPNTGPQCSQASPGPVLPRPPAEWPCRSISPVTNSHGSKGLLPLGAECLNKAQSEDMTKSDKAKTRDVTGTETKNYIST